MRGRRGTPAAVLLVGALASMLAAARADAYPMLEGDPRDPMSGGLIELLPGIPWLRPGADGELGTADDVLEAGTVGDVDLVLRAGVTTIGASLPATTPLRGGPLPVAVAGLAGRGTPVPFVVVPTDGGLPPQTGAPVVSPSLEGTPALVMAFADLDGDGFVGVTSLDGEAADAPLEEEELDPVGLRFAFFENGEAAGGLHLGIGGPAGAPVRVVLAAAAYAGPTRPDFFGGVVPDGPAVMTQLPFLPRTDPQVVIEGDLPSPADPDGLVGVQVQDVFTPDPTAIYGEAFTRSTDGSDVTTDVAWARSGPVSRFGIARPADAARFEAGGGGRLRRGIDAAGAPLLLEVLNELILVGDPSTPRALQVVPLDALGNVADPGSPELLLLSASGGLSIVAPDGDGDPEQETLQVTDARGAGLQVRGSGSLVIERVPEPGTGAGILPLALLLAWRARRRCAQPGSSIRNTAP